MTKTRIGVIGLGWIADSYMLPVLTRFDDVTVSGICDVDSNRLAATGKKFNIEKKYSDYRDLLGNGDVDGVMVAVHPTHTAKISRACLDRGIPTYLEKPPGISPEETQGICSSARENNAKAMVAFNRRYWPLVKQVQKIITDKGALTQFSFEFFKSRDTDPSSRETAFDPLVGTIVHGVDLLRFILGDPEKVMSDYRMIDSTVNNSFLALFKFPGGVSGTMNTSWTAGTRLERYSFHGPGYSVFMESPDRAWLYFSGEKEEILPATESVYKIPGDSLPGYNAGFPQEIRAFIDWISSGQEPATTIEDGLKTMVLLGKIREAGINK